ncbi:hypothetical protein EI546_08940 [Aequorivita sp. H23M31]|uniref:Uncharacterized protein n=1 Tax=Aequorivita ciconiae TaxID=2494375 RepID=A0A410G3P2_9FLAO|nr:hypothetical protein [Aequorivita sp. H23M31]QAA81835.1 hypothetical protein EI546_08940 [Aequorivita sp. H23M31]
MSTGYSRSPKLLKGALIEFSERFIGPIPNVIVFQYNPETMTRTLEVWSQNASGESSAGTETSHTAQPFDPPETFSLALELDATDALEKPESHPVAFISGVADRIAAMEMLLYPQGDSLLGGLLGSISGSLSVGSSGGSIGGGLGGASGGVQPVPRGTVPVVMFVWGPGRIIPVRLTSFSVEELAYSPLLYPIRAKVSIGLKILTPKDFPSCYRKLSEELAITAFKFTRKQKEVLAAANMANSVESILGMLPF